MAATEQHPDLHGLRYTSPEEQRIYDLATRMVDGDLKLAIVTTPVNAETVLRRVAKLFAQKGRLAVFAPSERAAKEVGRLCARESFTAMFPSDSCRGCYPDYIVVHQAERLPEDMWLEDIEPSARCSRARVLVVGDANAAPDSVFNSILAAWDDSGVFDVAMGG